MIPYIEGESDRIKCTLTNISTIQMLGCLLMKAKLDLDKKSVIYQVSCRDCSKVYIGETAIH